MTNEAQIAGEILRRTPDGWLLLDGEDLYVFDKPNLTTLRPGYVVVVKGRHLPSPGRDRIRRFEARWVDCDWVDRQSEREAWLSQQAAPTAPTPGWKRLTVIGTLTAVRDVERAFSQCHLTAPRSVVTRARARDIVIALRAEAAKQPDVILLVRGGGAGVHMYNDIDLLKAIVEVQRAIPVVVGIGHDGDDTGADLVATSHATPSLAGRYLADLRLANPEGVQESLYEQQRALLFWKVAAAALFFLGAVVGAVFGAAQV